MFGEELGDIVGWRACPRCGHPDAVLRAQKVTEQSENLLCRIACEKCHLVKHSGLVTERALKINKQLRKLNKQLLVADSLVQRERIKRKIETLEERKRLSELGL
jgi:ribosomal protein S27AE